jgi:peptidyl-prolyl cis-trans isomerase SurA
MQNKIVEEIEITPEEVRQFFYSIPKYERPVFGAELELAQIVIEPDVSKEEEDKIIRRLETIKNDVVVNGSSFATKAILYSQDPGSRATGGMYTLNRNRPQMHKEFRDVVYRLREGEVSDPFKTESGWHIVKVEKIRGQEVDARHILLIPEVTNEALTEAKREIDLIRKRIVDGELTFSEAAKSLSDETATSSNGGVLINPTTGDTKFELTKMDPILYSQAQRLKDNEISMPLLDEDRRGVKKYKIIKVSNRFDEHIADYSKDYIKIKDLALKEKQLKEIQKWMVEKIEDTYISINKDNQSCNFTNKWVKN